MLQKGLIQLYTGNSEQSNFAPFGLTLRAAGHNFRILIACFAPHDLMRGAKVASSLLGQVEIDHSAIDWMEKRLRRNKALDVFQRARQRLLKGEFDIIILNGVIPLINEDVIGLMDIAALMEEKPHNVELILSGPGASEDIIEKADLVTEMVVHSSPNISEKEVFHEDGGAIEVITGNGKGKTTYCLGKAMLISCLGIRSRILQFIKSPKLYGEVKAIKRLPLLEISSMGEGFLDFDSNGIEKRHVDAANRAWEECVREVFSLKYRLMVLDEIDNAIHHGLVNLERVREMLHMKPGNLNLLLSGRNAHPDVMETATTVIEMKEIKHPFKNGIKARKGIEF